MDRDHISDFGGDPNVRSEADRGERPVLRIAPATGRSLFLAIEDAGAEYVARGPLG